MSNQLTIHIPFELAKYAIWQRKIVTSYNTNRIIKALDTWLILKAQSRPSLIQRWNFQKNYLFSICKITESVFRSRLKLLSDLDLVQYDRNNIRLCSWDHLAARFEINVDEKFTIQYNLNDKQRIQDWIIATEIKANRESQAYSIFKKLNKNPVNITRAINAILNAGADRSRLKDSSYVLAWLMILYRQDFVQASEIHDLLVEIRPDTNRGVITIASHWKAKHPTLVTYWKKILEKSGIAYISKLQIQSLERVRNSNCKVLWLKQPKETMLCLCDDIQILEPWIALQTICKGNTDNAEC